MLLLYRVYHIEFSSSVVITESRQNARLELTKLEKRQTEVVHRQLILMLNQIYSTSHMVVLSNIRAYSDYDFSDGHRMQSGGRKGSIRLISSIRGKKCVFISPSFLSFLSSSPLLSYGAFNLWMKQFSLMWLASSSASSDSHLLLLHLRLLLLLLLL
ncbi:hypothetical protein Tco_1240620 [Tanacetum coccineum]